MGKDRPIAVVGGTGMLGRPVVEALVSCGLPVRVLSRGSAELPGAAQIRGDVNDPSALGRLLDGCSAVHISLRGTSPAGLWNTEVEGTRAIVTAARTAGVERIGYLSGAGVEAADPALCPVAVKQAAEAAVRESGSGWTIFRATHFMESLDLFVRGKRIELMTPQPLGYHYLAAADYAQIVASALVDGGTEERAITVLGPDSLTMAEAIAIYRERLRPDLGVRKTPTAVIRLIARLTRNAELAHAAMLFAAFPCIPETGDRSVADRLLGRPHQTLEQWCAARAA